MPTLTGSLVYVTGQPVIASAIRRVKVRAPAPRVNGPALITTLPVQVGVNGALSVDLEPGPATLTADYTAGHAVFDLYVEAGMTTIHQAALAALADRR